MRRENNFFCGREKVLTDKKTKKHLPQQECFRNLPRRKVLCATRSTPTSGNVQQQEKTGNRPRTSSGPFDHPYLRKQDRRFADLAFLLAKLGANGLKFSRDTSHKQFAQ
ncbi:hypothetical protein NDU88_004010 [Pleurodeles waltl]|uniref:Uncharacterized protein n=1 Tax=Pleurodeles waltl TaxID=8319 RepID=A0AAV7UEX5_PLEWA|nr:hypothetical protein NDU88_004010 [Pleurodeles waltl]